MSQLTQSSAITKAISSKIEKQYLPSTVANTGCSSTMFGGINVPTIAMPGNVALHVLPTRNMATDGFATSSDAGGGLLARTPAVAVAVAAASGNGSNEAAAAAAKVAPGTTLLKATLLQPRKQQHQQNHRHQIILENPKAQQSNVATNEADSKMFVALGTEVMKAPPTIIATAPPALQRLTQISLLQTVKAGVTESSDAGGLVLRNGIENSKRPTPDAILGRKAVLSERTKPQKVATGTAEKQESLLKVKPLKLIKLKNTSPRTKRSKSLNSGIKGSGKSSSERRHSTPSGEDNAAATKTSHSTEPSKVKSKRKAQELFAIVEVYDDENGELEASEEKSISNAKDITPEMIVPDEVLIAERKEPHAEAKTVAVDEAQLMESNKQQEFEGSTLVIIENPVDEGGKCASVACPPTEAGREEMKLFKKGDIPIAIIEDDDDEVTILPIEEKKIEQIEIEDDDDDDEEEDVNRNNIDKDAKKNNQSLLCDEQLFISSSSTVSASSSDRNSSGHENAAIVANAAPAAATTNSLTLSTSQFLHSSTPPPLVRMSNPAAKTSAHSCPVADLNGYSTVLDMLSNFNMLTWRERIGSARGTKLRFQLNEFNLIQIAERCPPRYRIHTAYEKPIYEREPQTSSANSEQSDPLLYLCRRCKGHGPATDFLAPEFCSLECLRRDTRKRQRDSGACILRKRSRKNDPIPSALPTNTGQKPRFRWSNYMRAKYIAIAAPIDLFLNPFPTGPNNFEIGMKVEAIDPENCSLFCVCTVVDRNGYRLKLSFDGYDSMYDFWLNADSMDIFPPGWCAKTNRVLQPPKNVDATKFNWSKYLAKEKAVPAPRHLFTHLNSSSVLSRNPFEIGMHLEAEDLNDTGKLCVATVADVLDDRIRIHFDGWDDCYDIIVDIHSPYIHPCGWHEGRQQLIVPPDYENSAFNWPDYIRQQASGIAAHEELFVPRDPINFKQNMKLEVVDPRNPSLIRPATVVGHKGHRVKLHLDGWSNDYCFWLEDDSPDLHPIGWCDTTGHDLEPPPGYYTRAATLPCPIEGCRGIGNTKKQCLMHATRDCCPYAPENWRDKIERPTRIENSEIVRHIAPKPQQSATNKLMAQQRSLSEQQILERIQMLDNIKTRRMLMQQAELPKPPAADLLRLPLASASEETKDNIPTSTSDTVSAPSATSTTNGDNADAILDANLCIAKEFLCDYGPRLRQNYKLWQQNFTFDAEKIKRNPLMWSTMETSAFVEHILNCTNAATAFIQEDIDGAALLSLQQSDLTDSLGFKLGPAVKLFSTILQLRTLVVTCFDVQSKICRK